MAEQRQVNVFCGSLVPGSAPSTGNWFNAGLFLPAEGVPQIYRRTNLAMNERGRLQRRAVNDVPEA